jgi:uncharacterized protein (TIRG00374 family)
MVVYLYENRDVFSSLKNLEIQYIVYIVLSQIGTVAVGALLNQRVIRTLNKDISYGDAFYLQYANNFLNKIISEGGAVFRGYFLKEIYKLPYTKYISTIAGSYILSFLNYSVMGLVSVGYIYFVKGKINYWVLVFFVGLLVGTGILILIHPRFENKKNYRVLKWVNSVLDGWEKIKGSKKELFVFTGLILLMLVLHVPQAVFVYRGLGESIGIFESLYMSSVGIITTFINITPNSIGIKEGIYMFSSDVIGLNSDIILLGALITRAVSLISSFIFGGISYLKLAPRLKEIKCPEETADKI